MDFTADQPPPCLSDYLANPSAIPPDKLVELTQDYYLWSQRNTDNPRSQHHRWYYALALECERRGWNLNKVLEQACYPPPLPRTIRR